MKSSVYLTVTFFLFCYQTVAQKTVFGNEWINTQQVYYKIPIAQKGLYRVTHADLQRAGLPLATLVPQAIQLFHRGQEQAIVVAGEADGKFDPTDYLEFLGQGADGVADSVLYRPVSAQPHPYFNLYTDTTAYFLTVRPDAQPGKRITAYTDLDTGTGTSALVPEAWVWAEERRVFSDQWSGGAIYPTGSTYGNGVLLSSQDVGEGFMGTAIKPQTTYSQSVLLGKAIATPLATPTLELIVIGRTPVAHAVRVQVGSGSQLRTVPPLLLTNFETKTLTISLSASEVSGHVTCALTPQNENDEVSMAVLTATYPHQPDLGGYTYREFRLNPVAGGRALLRLTSVPATARFFDITTPGQPVILSGTLVNGTFTSVVRGVNTSRKLLMVSVFESVSIPQRVVFRNLNPAKINFVLIAHPATRLPIPASPDAVAEYAAYRASGAGGAYDTLTVSPHQLYNQFNYGERSVVAIRRFADFLARGSADTKYMLLVGRSVEPHQNVRKNSFADTLDMIPNGGFPGSDLTIVAGIAGRPAFVPGVAISRLYVTRPAEVLTYLAKLKEHEAAPNTAPWRKQMLNLSGGKSAMELTLFRLFVDDFARNLTGPVVAGTVETLSKQTDNPTEDLPIAGPVNRGVGIITLFGHSSLGVSDVNLGYVSDDRLGYRNKGRYPLLLASGCAAGNFFYYIKGVKTFITDWVLTPDRGAVLALAHTYNGFSSPLKAYADQLYAVLADSAWVGSTFGQIQVETIRRYLLQNNSVYDLANAEQIALQGDPAIRALPFTRPDFTFSTGGIGLTPQGSGTRLTAVLQNLGRGSGRGVVVRVRQYTASGQLLLEQRVVANADRYADTLRLLLPTIRLADTVLELTVNPDNGISEERVDNNILRINGTGTPVNLPFMPDNVPPVLEVAVDGRRLANGDFVSARPDIAITLTDDNLTLTRTDPTGLELYLQRPCGQPPCPFERLVIGPETATWSTVGGRFQLSYRPAQPLPDGLYTLEVYGADLSGNRARPYAIDFTVQQRPLVSAVVVAPNPFWYQTEIRFTLAGNEASAAAVLHLFDLAGRRLRSVSIRPRIGENVFVWDGTNDAGTMLPAGSYGYRLELPGYDAFEGTAKKQLTGRILLAR